MRSVGFCLLLGFAAAGRAQVAVAVTKPDNNTAHRDVAAGLVDAVDDGWLMLSPQIDPVQIATCSAEVDCLLRASLGRGATHLLAIGIAGLGVRDYVVSFQLYDSRGQKLVDENTVVVATSNPLADGAALAASLVRVPGLPQSSVPSSLAHNGDATSTPSPLALTGMLLVASSVVVGVGTAVAAFSISANPSSASQRDAIVTGTVVASSVAVLLAVSGAGCVLSDVAW